VLNRAGRWFAFAAAFRFNASSQGFHKIDDLGGRTLLWYLDLFAVLFLLEQLFHGNFVLVLEFLGIELTCLRLNDTVVALGFLGASAVATFRYVGDLC
jgi:hypothetical protein